MVDRLTPNQVRVLRKLSHVKRYSRAELIKTLHLNPTSLQFALVPLKGFFIAVEREKNKEFLSLTKAGEIAVRAFNLANGL